jgi:hypothetical protein
MTEEGLIISPRENYFDYSDEFEKELVQMSKAGIKGYIIVCGESGDWYKYVLSGDGKVSEYLGNVVFQKRAKRIYK